MNILLTCAGRRNYLVQFFQRALGRRGEVIACDSSGSAPALREADRRFIVPRMDHPEYVAELLAICQEHAVRLLCSSNDLELSALSQHAARFRAVGTIPVVAAPPTIAICQDKWATFHWLRARQLDTPDTYASLADAGAALAQGLLAFPLLIKPRFGTSSIGVERVENDRELTLAHEWVQVQLRRTILARWTQTDAAQSLLIQQYVDGQEYGMDIINDLSGRHVCTLARRKLVMRAGNTDRAVTVSEPSLDRIGAVIGQSLAHLGSLDCDVIRTERGCCVLDLNPRFGGGYPFSHLAGANLPAALIAWANGEEPDPGWLRATPGILSSKYDGVAIAESGVRSQESGVRSQESGVRSQESGIRDQGSSLITPDLCPRTPDLERST
jgi:carbamoyl-phosphate synthase large subunit